MALGCSQLRDVPELHLARARRSRIRGQGRTAPRLQAQGLRRLEQKLRAGRQRGAALSQLPVAPEIQALLQEG